MRLLPATILLATALASGAISGAPLAYKEAINGDLGFGAVTMLPLDIGTNYVEGSMHHFRYSSQPPSIDWDADPVAFSLPAGMRITGFVIFIDFILDGRDNLASSQWTWHLSIDGANSLSTCFAFIGPSSDCPDGSRIGGALFTGALGTGQTYLVTHSTTHAWNNFNTDSSAQFNYAMGITVSSVPEPETLWLVIPLIAHLFVRSKCSGHRGK
jgi:hypothetical protein